TKSTVNRSIIAHLKINSMIFFFFSSRRRHTRSKGDWSSDVCSSDLKMANVDYFELLHILEFKKAERVKDCAEVLEYKVSYETGEKTLYRVWFCKSRLCPMCNWRRAMKHGIQSQKVVAEVIKQ